MNDLDRAARFILESNAIEGVRAPSFGELRDRLKHDSETGHAGAFLAFVHKARDKRLLTQADLFDAHRLILFEEIETALAWNPGEDLPENIARLIGAWRTDPIGGGRFASPTLVPASMDSYFLDLQEFQHAPRTQDEAVDFAADMHWRYEKIHPFADGNGRTGRLVVCYLLHWYALPLAVFMDADKREAYYPACASDDSMLMRAYLHERLAR